jgi:hypothetical protein
MIKLTKCKSSDISLSELERLYNEAFPYISEERKRMGDKALKSALLDGIQHFPIIKYEVNDFLVGIASYTDIAYNNKRYMMHLHPIYGCDINGSKAWWYTEEFQQKNSEYVSTHGCAGVITAFNPASPAAKAVISHFGSFQKYYNTPYILDDMSNIGLVLNDTKLSVLIIDLYNK